MLLGDIGSPVMSPNVDNNQNIYISVLSYKTVSFVPYYGPTR